MPLRDLGEAPQRRLVSLLRAARLWHAGRHLNSLAAQLGGRVAEGFAERTAEVRLLIIAQLGDATGFGGVR